MNTIREIQALNKRELENGVSTEASWHADYRDTAYVYIGGLSFDLSEGDIITIFSQFGEPVHVNLVRDRDTGKSKGFAFLKYEDQRSTDLAVDNLGGASVMGRILKVDHTRYKRKDDEEITDNTKHQNGAGKEGLGDEAEAGRRRKKRRSNETESEPDSRPVLKEEKELAELKRDHDEDDPMKEYLIKQKKEEIRTALAGLRKKKSRSYKDGESRHNHRHHSRRQEDEQKKRHRYVSHAGHRHRPASRDSALVLEPDHKHRRGHKRERDRSVSTHRRD